MFVKQDIKIYFKKNFIFKDNNILYILNKKNNTIIIYIFFNYNKFYFLI